MKNESTSLNVYRVTLSRSSEPLYFFAQSFSHCEYKVNAFCSNREVTPKISRIECLETEIH